YRPGNKTLNDPPFVDQRTFNYAIKGQDGRRFWGEIKSGDRTEPFAAAISLDNKYAYGADSEAISTSPSCPPTRWSFATRNLPTSRATISPPASRSSAPASDGAG